MDNDELVQYVKAQDRKRLAFERALAKKVAGSEAAAARVRKNWQAIPDSAHDLSRAPEPDEPIVHTKTRWTPGDSKP